MNASTPFAVTTRDVDGTSTRSYKTFASAKRRFEEMLGYDISGALDDIYYQQIDAGLPVPSAETLPYIRAVSNYGTVVILVNNTIGA